MNAVTMVSDSKEDQQVCEQECQLAEAAFAEGRELAAWKRFGTISFESYASWVVQNLPVIRQA